MTGTMQNGVIRTGFSVTARRGEAILFSAVLLLFCFYDLSAQTISGQCSAVETETEYIEALQRIGETLKFAAVLTQDNIDKLPETIRRTAIQEHEKAITLLNSISVLAEKYPQCRFTPAQKVEILKQTLKIRRNTVATGNPQSGNLITEAMTTLFDAAVSFQILNEADPEQLQNVAIALNQSNYGADNQSVLQNVFPFTFQSKTSEETHDAYDVLANAMQREGKSPDTMFGVSIGDHPAAMLVNFLMKKEPLNISARQMEDVDTELLAWDVLMAARLHAMAKFCVMQKNPGNRDTTAQEMFARLNQFEQKLLIGEPIDEKEKHKRISGVLSECRGHLRDGGRRIFTMVRSRLKGQGAMPHKASTD
ncbi:MAG: hypothetical protein R6V03_06710 [Kiritimatiellia bacterium]